MLNRSSSYSYDPIFVLLSAQHSSNSLILWFAIATTSFSCLTFAQCSSIVLNNFSCLTLSSTCFHTYYSLLNITSNSRYAFICSSDSFMPDLWLYAYKKLLSLVMNTLHSSVLVKNYVSHEHGSCLNSKFSYTLTSIPYAHFSSSTFTWYTAFSEWFSQAFSTYSNACEYSPMFNNVKPIIFLTSVLCLDTLS